VQWEYFSVSKNLADYGTGGGTPKSSAMDVCVAVCAERDQVLFGVVARVVSKFLVMDLQVRHCPARLTPPAIATQDRLPQSLVRHRIQPQGRRLWTNRAHDAFSMRTRNVCRCSSGRNLKNLVIENSSVSGSPLSRLAPARKSAQIISKQ
jgi:hypothetical protein